MIKTINNEEKVECCILVADVIINELKLSYSYSIPIDDIEEAKQSIRDIFNYFGNSCLRVYISGFMIISPNFLWTKDQIINQVQSETNRINKINKGNLLMKSLPH